MGRRPVSHTVPVSDSGFVDEARTGPGRPQGSQRSQSSEDSGRSAARPSRRRPGLVGAGFAGLVVALLAFGAWAWSGRVHADDVAAYESLAHEIGELDHTLPPLGHSDIPPCRDVPDGAVTRSYPPSTGPQAAELVGYLEQTGWAQQGSGLPVYAHLTRTAEGHLLTIDVLAPSDTSLVGSLTARSAASSFGCLLR